MKRILEALQSLDESTNDQEVIVGDIDDEFDYESVNETEITPINFELKEPFNKYYKVVSVSEAAEAIGADEMDMLSASQINGYSVKHVAWLLAKPAYFNVLSYESYEVVEVVAEEGSEPFICSIVGGRIYNIENDILEAINDIDNSVDVNYIYLFPLDEEDLEVPFGRYEDALDYGLEILGVNRFQDELNLVVRGKKEDLEYFADDYLGGYQLHPDYLYIESDFAGDIESNQKMLDHDYWREQLKKHNDVIATINIDADNAYGDDPLEIIRNVAFLQPGFISPDSDSNYFSFTSEEEFEMQLSKVSKKEDESLNESSDAQKIIGFDTVNHVRKYYNEEKDEFVDNEAEATIFTNYNLAQLTWFGLVDKKNPKKFRDQFDRIFIVVAK